MWGKLLKQKYQTDKITSSNWNNNLQYDYFASMVNKIR